MTSQDGACIKSSCECESRLSKHYQTLPNPLGMEHMNAQSGLTVRAPKEEEKPSRLAPASVVYWSRLGFAVLAGIVYNILGMGLNGLLVGTFAAIAMGVLFYAASVFAVKYLMGYSEDQLKGPRKHISLGMGSYIIWLLFTIILLNTILFARP